MREYGISARLTFSNSLLKEKHLSDRKCNALCALLEENKDVQNGVIVHSDLLLEYLKKHYPHLYFVSSTTKVITDFKQLVEEIRREDFRYVVPDFRLNKAYDQMEDTVLASKKTRWSFCAMNAAGLAVRTGKPVMKRSAARILEKIAEHHCTAPESEQGYCFSKAMQNPGFIGIEAYPKCLLSNGIF